MKCKRSLFVISFFLMNFASTAISADEVHVRQDASVTSYNVHGTPERSFYPKHKTRYLYEGEVDFKKKISGGNELYGDFLYRSTDDPLIDRQIGFSIEKFFVGMKNETFDVLLGDYFASFSDYSLSNALKGIKLERARQGNFRFISVAGVDTPKWEDLWENRAEDASSRRYVWGERIESYYFDDRLQVDFNYAGAWDDWAHFSQSASPMSVQVGSIDWKAELYKPLTFRGEWALSYSDVNARMSDIEAKMDSGLKAALDFTSERYELSSEYSRVGAHFNTTGGFSSQDLESLLFDGTAYLPHSITVAHYLHLDQDNLKKLKSTTTKQINPGTKVSFKLPAEWKGDLGWDLRKRYTTDTTVGDLTNVYSGGLSKDFRFFYLSTRYAATVVENYKIAEQNRLRHTVTVGLDGDFELKKVKIYWNFADDLQLEEYSKIGECKQDLLLSPSAGLKAVFPSTLTLDGKITFNDNDYYILATDSNSNKYHFAISRDVIRDLVVAFTYDQNDYYYESGTGNYFEIIMMGKINYKF